MTSASTRLYCMSGGHHLQILPDGTVHGQRDDTDVYTRAKTDNYNTYKSQKYQVDSWYVALKRNGKPELGPRTHIGRKAIFFLPRRLD